MRTRLCLGAIVALVAARGPVAGPAGEWGTARGGPSRTGTSDYASISLTAGQFGLVWRRDLGSPVSAEPIIAGGRVIVADTQGILHAVDLLTGVPVWRRALGAPVLAAATAAGDQLLIPCADGGLVSVAQEDGTERWRTALPATAEAAPAVRGSTAYVVTRGGQVLALDISREGAGAVRWARPLGAPSFAPPALQGGTLAVLAVDGTLHCFDPADGTPRWTAALGAAPCYTAPAVTGGEVVAVSGAGICAAFAAGDGTERFRVHLGEQVSASPAVGADRIVVVTEGGDCRVLDREDGSILWRKTFEGGGPYRAGVVADPEWIFVASTSGRIHIKSLAATYGSLVDVHPMTNDRRAGSLRAAPALHPHGFVGVRSDGLLFAYREAAGDVRMVRLILGLPSGVSRERLAGWVAQLAGPDPAVAGAAARELCRHGHEAADVLERQAADGTPAAAAAAAPVRAHLDQFLRLSAVVRSHLAASRLARRKLWRACLADPDPAVARAAARRWPADADAALLKGFDPSASQAIRRAFVRALPR